MAIQQRSSPSSSGADSNIANLKMDGKLQNDGVNKESAQVNEPTSNHVLPIMITSIPCQKAGDKA